MDTYDSKKNKVEVRQGSSRKLNMRVLVISMIAIVVLFGLVMAWDMIMQANA